jgi:mono/diheme cytochrome c family protein
MYAIAAVGALAAVSATVLYATSEVMVRRTYTVPAPTVALALPADPADLAEGKRLATIRGCYEGCHGIALEGHVFFEEPGVARLVAPNLTAAVARYSNAELERIVRHGVLPSGRSVWAMPSDMFRALSDEDLARILAFLRSAPPSEGPGPSLHMGPLGRLGVVARELEPAAVLAARSTYETPVLTPRHDAFAFGRYLAQTSCSECHGLDLRGGGGSPGLVVAAAYSLEEFAQLMRTGEARGGRELGLMARVARVRFAQFTAEEVRVLHEYLRTLIDGERAS